MTLALASTCASATSFSAAEIFLSALACACALVLGGFASALVPVTALGAAFSDFLLPYFGLFNLGRSLELTPWWPADNGTFRVVVALTGACLDNAGNQGHGDECGNFLV